MKDINQVIEQAVDHNGYGPQLNMAVEECCELGAGINHYRRKKIEKSALIKEMVQVQFSIAVLQNLWEISDGVLEEAMAEHLDETIRKVTPK